MDPKLHETLRKALRSNIVEHLEPEPYATSLFEVLPQDPKSCHRLQNGTSMMLFRKKGDYINWPRDRGALSRGHRIANGGEVSKRYIHIYQIILQAQ